MARGYIYVLVNPRMPGLAKVGKTTRLPSERAAELSSATGVPSPFVLLYEQPVDDCDTAEAWVHEQLDRLGQRPSRNREFFDAPPHVIVKTVFEAARACSAPSVTDQVVASSDEVELKGLADSLYRESMKLKRGDENCLPDIPRALELIEQAARHGHRQAQAEMIDVYSRRGNPQRALDICRVRIDAGEWWFEAKRASVFDRAGHLHLAEERRKAFFQAARGHIEMGSLEAELVTLVAGEGLAYIEAVADNRVKPYVPRDCCAVIAPLVLASFDCRVAETEKLTVGPTPSGNARIELHSLLRRRRQLAEAFGVSSEA